MTPEKLETCFLPVFGRSSTSELPTDVRVSSPQWDVFVGSFTSQNSSEGFPLFSLGSLGKRIF